MRLCVRSPRWSVSGSSSEGCVYNAARAPKRGSCSVLNACPSFQMHTILIQYSWCIYGTKCRTVCTYCGCTHTQAHVYFSCHCISRFLPRCMTDLSVGHLTTLYELQMLGFELGDRMLYRVNWEGNFRHMIVLFRHLPGKTEENHGNFMIAVPCPRFEPCISRIQVSTSNGELTFSVC
jgi:hypothetical protein